MLAEGLHAMSDFLFGIRLTKYFRLQSQNMKGTLLYLDQQDCGNSSVVKL